MRGALLGLALAAGLAGSWSAPASAQEEPSPPPTSAPTPVSTPPIFHEREVIFPPFAWVEPRLEKNGYHSTFHMFMLLWWDADNSTRSYHTLLPFFYQRKDKLSGSNGFYIPPVYYESGEQIRRFGVPPLFWYGRVGKEKTIWGPVFVYDEREGRRLLATPLGGGWGNQEDWQGFVGPYYWRNASTPEEFHAHVLFPLFWQFAGKDWSTWIAGPLFRSASRGEGGTSYAFGLVPLFYERTAPGGGKTVVTPLSVFERHDRDSSFLVTPLGGYARSPDRAVTVIGPWYSSRDHDERLSMLFPVFFHGSYRTSARQVSWSVLGPWWQRRQTWETPQGTRTALDRALLPLFWYGRRDGDVRVVSPLAIWHKHPDGELNGLFGPLFLTDTHDRFGWFLLPGIWYGHGPRLKLTAGVGPLYFGENRKGETWAGLVPLFFFHNLMEPEGRHRLVTLLPLFLFGERPGYLTFLSPLYAQIRSPGEHRIMAGWLWWDHWTASGYRNLTFFPLFHWRRVGDERLLYTPVGFYERSHQFRRWLWGPDYGLRDEALHLRQDVVFPVYWRYEDPARKVLFAFPYYQHREGRYFTEAVLPLWYHTEYPGASRSLLLPFFWIQTDTVERSRLVVTPLGGWFTGPTGFQLLLPLVYYAAGPDKHSTVLFPFFWYDYDHGHQTLVVPPFFHHRDPTSLTWGVVPALYYHRDPERTRFLSPGVFFARSGQTRWTAVFPPLYWWYRDPDRSAGLAGLWMWSKSRSDPADFFRMLFPFFLDRSLGPKRDVACPVFWHHRNDRSTWNAGPGFGWATHLDEEGRIDGWNLLAGPVYYRTQRPTTAGAPGAGDLVVFPFFWSTHHPDGARTALLPLFFYGRTGTRWSWLAPGFGGGGDPAIDRSWWWVLLAGHLRQGDESRSAFFPFAWWRQSPRRFTLATPLLWHDRDKETGTTRTVAPLFFHASGQGRSTTVLFPLFWDYRDGEAKSRSVGVLPFFFAHSDPEWSWTLVPPLLSLWVNHGEESLGIYGPLITARTGEGRTVALFPLFRWHQDPQGSSFAMLPCLWWIVHPDGKSRGFVGVGYWNSETGTRFWLPGYFRFQTHDGGGNVTHTTEVAGPFYVHYRSPTKDIKVIPPWFQVKRPDGERIHGIAPFWWSRRGSEDNQPYYHWSLLGDLIGYQKKGDYHRWVFFWAISTRPHLSRGLQARRAASPSGLQGPDADRTVRAAGDQEPAVRREGQGEHRLAMGLDDFGEGGRAAVHPPEPDGPVVAPAGGQLPVGGEGAAHHRLEVAP